MTRSDGSSANLTGQTPRQSLRIGELTGIEELERCLDIQREVWGGDDSDLMGVTQLRACQLAGGLIAGVYSGDELIAFSSSLPAHRTGEPAGLHSDMTGVRPAFRSQGIGRLLKFYQRHWCQERGIGWVQWTFDPLRAANARFNLEHLGAFAVSYLPNAYGSMADELNRGVPSDRLLARWELDYPGVVARVDGQPPQQASVDQAQAVSLLDCDERNRPVPTGNRPGPVVSVAVPGEQGRLWEDRELVMEWRAALRSTLAAALKDGYLADRFADGRYLARRVGRDTSKDKNELYGM